MKSSNSTPEGRLVHVVTLKCKDADRAAQCLEALSNQGRPDAMDYNCLSYEFGLREGSKDTVVLIERWTDWDDLNLLLMEKVVPALPLYNQLLEQPFNPARDTVRINLSAY